MSPVLVCMFACQTHPSLSVRSHRTLGVGISGEPSYKTTEAPTARADTSQFHIIQPVYKHTQQHNHLLCWFNNKHRAAVLAKMTVKSRRFGLRNQPFTIKVRWTFPVMLDFFCIKLLQIYTRKAYKNILKVCINTNKIWSQYSLK